MTFPSNSAVDFGSLHSLDCPAVPVGELMGLAGAEWSTVTLPDPVGTSWGASDVPLLATAATVPPQIEAIDAMSPLGSCQALPVESPLDLTGQTCSGVPVPDGLIHGNVAAPHSSPNIQSLKLAGVELETASLEKTPGAPGQVVTAWIYWTSRHAGFDNEMGLFWVDDAAGRIGELLPEDAGYAEAALAEERRQVIFHPHQTAGAMTTVCLPGDTYVGWYLIQDASSTDFLNTNPSNQIDAGPLAFFSLPQSNPDGFQHLQPLPSGEYAWEDLVYGGDRDFNDLVFRYEFLAPPAPPPHLEVADLTLMEGDEGVQAAQFTVRLSAPSADPVTVDFRTVTGTAVEGIDYSAVQGQLTFAPGAVTQTIAVPIWGDRVDEADQTFYVELLHAVNADILNGRAIGTLVDDDEPLPVPGKVVVAHDDWTISDPGFAQAPDTTQFVANLAAYFAADKAGNFLAYSNNFGLTGTHLAQTMAMQGHTWTVSIQEPFTLDHLQQYDAVFVGGYAVDNTVLRDYVQQGGNVYLMAGTGTLGKSVDEAAAWAPFLNSWGLAYAETFNPSVGNHPVSALTHAIFADVERLYQVNGNSIIDLDAEDDRGTILTWGSDGLGLYAIYDPA